MAAPPADRLSYAEGEEIKQSLINAVETAGPNQSAAVEAEFKRSVSALLQFRLLASQGYNDPDSNPGWNSVLQGVETVIGGWWDNPYRRYAINRTGHLLSVRNLDRWTQMKEVKSILDQSPTFESRNDVAALEKWRKFRGVLMNGASVGVIFFNHDEYIGHSDHDFMMVAGWLEDSAARILTPPILSRFVDLLNAPWVLQSDLGRDLISILVLTQESSSSLIPRLSSDPRRAFDSFFARIFEADCALLLARLKNRSASSTMF